MTLPNLQLLFPLFIAIFIMGVSFWLNKRHLQIVEKNKKDYAEIELFTQMTKNSYLATLPLGQPFETLMEKGQDELWKATREVITSMQNNRSILPSAGKVLAIVTEMVTLSDVQELKVSQAPTLPHKNAKVGQ